jgi:CRP-like cAMP-binding protein
MNKEIDFSIFPFFSDISLERQSEIESISFVQSHEKGSILFQKNEPARYIYGLIEGCVELNITFKEEVVTKDIKHEDYINTHIETFERPIAIEYVKENDILGWSALVEPERMTSTALCINDSKVALIPASDLKKIFNNDPELGYIISSRINALIARRLFSRTEKLVDAWCQLFDTANIQPSN